MAAATSEIDTPTRTGTYIHLPLAAATLIYAGTLVARDAAGRAVPAADTAGLRVVGRAAHTVDNSTGAAGAASINIEPGVFKYANSESNAIDADDVGKHALVEDDQTVAESSTHGVIAGRIVEVDADGVWIDTRYAYFGLRTLVTPTSTDGAAAAASDLGELKTETEKIGDDLRALISALNG